MLRLAAVEAAQACSASVTPETTPPASCKDKLLSSTRLLVAMLYCVTVTTSTTTRLHSTSLFSCVLQSAPQKRHENVASERTSQLRHECAVCAVSQWGGLLPKSCTSTRHNQMATSPPSTHAPIRALAHSARAHTCSHLHAHMHTFI